MKLRLFLTETTPDGTGDGAIAAWTPPEGLEQFKSPDDLAKSYQELRPEMDRLRSQLEAERAQFAETLAELEQTRQPVQQQTAGQFDPTVAAYADAMDRGDYQTAMQIQQQAMLQTMTGAVGQVLDERFKQFEPVLEQQTKAQREASIRMAEDLVSRQLGPDRYTELLPKISELAERYLPAQGSVESYRDAILDMAKLASYEDQERQITEFQQERAEKLAAQTVTGSGRGVQVATGDAAQQEFDRIKNATTGSYSELMNGRR